jgi:hypothetical protein
MAGLAEAQRPDGRRRSPLSLHVTGGFAVPVSPDPLAAGWKPGVMVGAAVRYRLSRNVVVDASFQYAQFAATPAAVIYDEEGNPVGATGRRTGTIYAGFAEVSWYPFPGASVVSPYLIGGFGYSGSNNFGLSGGRRAPHLRGTPGRPVRRRTVRAHHGEQPALRDLPRRNQAAVASPSARPGRAATPR